MGNEQQKETQNEDQNSPIDDEEEEYTCQICIEPMSSRNMRFNNDNECIHPFCLDCITKYIKAMLVDNFCNIQCPDLDCKNYLNPLALRPKIPRKLFDEWSELLSKNLVLEFDGVYCPNRNCSELVLNECRGNVKRTLCPKCKKPFCFHCKAPWHAGYRCEESGVLVDPSDIAFGELIERRRWQRCPRCGQCIERIDGCDFITCRCGGSFNYRNPTFSDLHWPWQYKVLGLALVAFVILIMFVVSFVQ